MNQAQRLTEEITLLDQMAEFVSAVPIPQGLEAEYQTRLERLQSGYDRTRRALVDLVELEQSGLRELQARAGIIALTTRRVIAAEQLLNDALAELHSMLQSDAATTYEAFQKARPHMVDVIGQGLSSAETLGSMLAGLAESLDVAARAD